MKSPNLPEAGVLVVDDDADTRLIVSEILRSEGYDVAEAENGADALVKLRASSRLPGVILLDVRMPVMDGPEFCDQQARDPQLAGVPVIIVTAERNAPRRATEMKTAGALSKPVQVADLLAVVGRYCRPLGTPGSPPAA